MKLESGIEIKKTYDQRDLAGWNPETELGQPGEYPFTRGIHPGMYCDRVWTMRQYTGFGNPKDTNERFKFLIAHGQTGLNVAFDLPTQQCLDSDDPMAEGEVGRVGMAVDSLRDFEVAFDGIPIDNVSVSLTINAPASIMIAMFLVVAEQKGIALDKVPGTAQNDILKEYIGRGAWVFDVPGAIKLIGDTIEFCAKVAPRYSPVSVCGYHVRESGATPAGYLCATDSYKLVMIPVELEEGDVAGPDLQGHQVVGKGGTNGHDHQEDHGGAVHGKDLVVELGRQQLAPGGPQLGADEQCLGAADDEEEHGDGAVHDADLLVIDGE
jgi:methylmalonyl-CoA mutase cobalamin-binding domain/chain